MDDAAALAAALAFERGCYRRAAQQHSPHPLGLALRDERVPRAHMLNMLWVTVDAATPDTLAGALETFHGDLQHRKAQVDDDALGTELAEPMRARGFAVERHLYMALRRAADRAPHEGPATEVDEATHAAVEAATTREEPHGGDPAVVEQLARARAAIRAEASTRFFVGTDDGVTASHATLLTRDGVAQVEDVATLQASRRRGLARAVCGAAVAAAAGRDLVFIVADDGDWPKELYGKLGFDPVGATWSFVRDPA